MKWYKFLINFALFASAVLGVISAIGMLTGSVYGEDKEVVYEVFSSIKTVDTIFAIIYIAAAVFYVYTRFALSGYKAIGPVLVMVVYAINGVLSLAYNLTVMSMIDKYSKIISTSEYKTSLITNAVTTVVVSIIMIIANKIYFDKRKALFVN